jgi:SAM-dependent methyltransferase
MSDDASQRLTARYDREAVAYRELWAPVLKVAGRRLIRELGGGAVRRIVDVGAGVGSLFEELQSTFPSAFIMGIDRSRGMLALAPPEMSSTVADARQLPLASDSVDLVVLAFILFHLESPIDALREARRAIRPGGRIGTVTWGGDFASRALRIWTDCLDAHGAAPPDPATQARHDPLNAPEKVSDLLRSVGFSRVRAWTEDLVHTIPIDTALALRMRMGSEKPRFDSLSGSTQETCVQAARRQMEELTAEDFIARGAVVYAVAA